MKKTLLICGIILLKLAAPALSRSGAEYKLVGGPDVPQGNPVGVTTYQTVSGLPTASISDVAVNLDITGGYNGGLYGYLTLQDANGDVATEILLNQVGTSPSNPFGLLRLRVQRYLE